jgi:PAS domain S-box-containing protein
MVALSKLRGRRRGESAAPASATSPRAAPVTLLEHVSDALFSVDRDWRLSYLNQAAERLLGASRDVLLGEILWDRFPDLVGSTFEQEYRAAVTGGDPVTFEACHPPLDTWVEVHAYPVPSGLDIQARDITPGMRAAETLQRWARVDDVRFRALVEHAADIVALLNADGTIRYISKAVERVLGYDPESLIGRGVYPLIHPDDLPRLLRLFDRNDARHDDALLVECRLRHADGGWRDIEISGSPQMDVPAIAGLVVSARDMTWRKQMERELHTREAFYEAIVDGSAIGIGVADLGGHFLTANRALQAFLACTEQEIVGSTLAEHAHVDDRWEDAQSIFEDLVRGEHTHYRRERRFTRRNGDTAWGSLTISLIREPNEQPTFALIMVEDVTERHRAGVELARARRRLAASREAERLRLARELHDGPVQDLLAASYELARESAIASREQGTLDASVAMERSRKHLLAVVTRLRGVVGELRPPGLIEFGLPIALGGFVTELQRETGGSAPAIRLDVDDQAADLPQGLAYTIFRIVQEALRNALRHADASEIVAEVDVEPSGIGVRVRDDGHGFAVPDRLDDLARTGHFGLVGLAERVEQVDGEFAMRSSPEQGTTITVRIPFGVGEGDGQDDSRTARG